MDCPKCRKKLFRSRFCGVEIDSCAPCDGIWFDHGELERYARSDRVRGKLESASSADFAPRGSSSLICPSCKKTSLVQGQLRSCEAGLCQSCFGVWVEPSKLPPPARKKMTDEDLLAAAVVAAVTAALSD